VKSGLLRTAIFFSGRPSRSTPFTGVKSWSR
jgi:hypothetical protein